MWNKLINFKRRGSETSRRRPSFWTHRSDLNLHNFLANMKLINTDAHVCIAFDEQQAVILGKQAEDKDAGWIAYKKPALDDFSEDFARGDHVEAAVARELMNAFVTSSGMLDRLPHGGGKKLTW